MNPFRSVGARLGLALAVVVAGALGVVWVALVPTLERRLVDARLAELRTASRAVEREISESFPNKDLIDEASRTADARVVYFGTIGGGQQTALLAQFDSSHLTVDQDIGRDPVALAAAVSGAARHGRIHRDGGSFLEVAVPDARGNVLLFSAPLHSTIQDVDLIRSRLLWAGLVALGLAVLVGWGGASVFARRIRRLESAAERIASGDFEAPVVDHGRDELGDLAIAFDRMRLQLAQLDDARRAFIANASHELRTPIFSLGGFLELLRDEDLDEATRSEFLGTASEQVERLAKLATDLLDLSRLDAGRMRLEREPVELAELVHDLAGEFGAVALRRGHPLETVVEAEGTVAADRERVLQIGRALVDNALLHTPPGTPVRIVARGPTLAVEDEGEGIPPDQVERVFARFTRLEGSRASGTGLGLAIAHELAQRMEGRLLLESAPGRTVFTLVLPVAALDREPSLVD